MPPLALANLFWLGRVHPDFQGLTLGTRLLLGFGRSCFRKLILGEGNRNEQYAALQGNTILLAQAQATTSQVLPPTEEEIGNSLVVAYCRSKQDVASAQMLIVSRSQYLRCAAIRKAINPVFAAASIDEHRVEQQIPVNGVPNVFLSSAVSLPEAAEIRCSMDGPAKRQGLFGKDEAETDEAALDSGCESAEADAQMSDTVEASNENSVMIGFDAAQDPEPAKLFGALQTKLDLLERETKKLVAASSDQQNLSCGGQQGSDSSQMQVSPVGQMRYCENMVVDAQDLVRRLQKVDKGKIERELLEAQEP